MKQLFTQKGVLLLAFCSSVFGAKAQVGFQPITSLAFNGISVVHENREKVHILSIPEQYQGKEVYRAAITFKKNTPTDRVYFDNKEVVSGDSVSFKAPIAKAVHKIEVVSKGRSTLMGITGSFLPIVELNTGEGINGKTYTLGRIRVINPNDKKATDQRFDAQLKYRGATAQTMQKKAFAVKLVDSMGKSVDGSFFGLRKDNNWILDAMAIDYARMRNRVCFDLWNDFSTKPYHQAKEPKTINGTRGHFVEIVLNGKYQGIYCMTEKLDRKQLKLKKFAVTESDTTLKGLLYKSKQWSYAVLMGHDIDKNEFPGTPPYRFDNKSDKWENFEMGYPEVADGEKISWEPLYNAIAKVASNDTATFAKEAANIFDLPVALDYYLLMDLILASDNHGKNMYYYVYDLTKSPKIGIAPWDMDGTWGRDYYSRNDFTAPDKDYLQYIWKHEHGELTLFKRLRETPSFQWEGKLKNRYAELRQTHFAPENLIKRFTTYATLFKESGADARERKLWNGADGRRVNIQQDVAEIKEWILQRVQYLDQQYGYDPTGMGHGLTKKASQVWVAGGKGCVRFYSPIAQKVTVYNLLGKMVESISLSANTSVAHALPAGIYLVDGKKVVVE